MCLCYFFTSLSQTDFYEHFLFVGLLGDATEDIVEHLDKNNRTYKNVVLVIGMLQYHRRDKANVFLSNGHGVHQVNLCPFNSIYVFTSILPV